jgi:DNA-binding MarR family transcriptional regulator
MTGTHPAIGFLIREVARLQQQGLIERRQHGADRRIWSLFLKDAARPLLADLQPIAQATRAEALSGLSAENCDSLITSLELMKTNLLAAKRAPIPEKR